MEWLKKLLETQGLEVEVINKIMEGAKDEKFIPKSRLDEVIEQKKELEKQLGERDTQLTELNKKVKGNEELEKTIAELQEANTKTKTEYETKLRDITINTAIQSRLADSKYADLLTTKFDRTKIVVNEDGSITGLDEQEKAVRETYADLFKVTVSGRTPSNTSAPAHPNSRRLELEKVISDTSIPLPQRVAARNELTNLKED